MAGLNDIYEKESGELCQSVLAENAEHHLSTCKHPLSKQLLIDISVKSK